MNELISGFYRFYSFDNSFFNIFASSSGAFSCITSLQADRRFWRSTIQGDMPIYSITPLVQQGFGCGLAAATPWS